MKKLCLALAALFVFALAAPALAIDVVGELVDLSCYNKDKVKNVATAHQECAVTCAKKGMTVALVTEKSEVYSIGGALAENNNARLVRHMGYKVAVQGSLGVSADGSKTILGGALKRVSPPK